MRPFIAVLLLTICGCVSGCGGFSVKLRTLDFGDEIYDSMSVLVAEIESLPSPEAEKTAVLINISTDKGKTWHLWESCYPQIKSAYQRNFHVSPLGLKSYKGIVLVKAIATPPSGKGVESDALRLHVTENKYLPKDSVAEYNQILKYKNKGKTIVKLRTLDFGDEICERMATFVADIDNISFFDAMSTPVMLRVSTDNGKTWHPWGGSHSRFIDNHQRKIHIEPEGIRPYRGTVLVKAVAKSPSGREGESEVLKIHVR